MKQHKDIATTIAAANAINKARTSQGVSSQLSARSKFRQFSGVTLVVALALLVAFWTAVAYWLPGLVSVSAAAAGACWSCVLVAVCWYFVVAHLTTD